MVRELAAPGDIVVFLGAGTVTQWAYALPGELAALEREPLMSKTAVAIRHVAFEDAGVWRDVLAGHGYDLAYVEAGVDALTDAAVLSADLLIVLGGPIGVYETDAYPFLVEEIEMVRRRLDAQKPILGVCLGAQLMAAALGARVAPGPAKEIGYAPVELTDAGRASPLARLEGLPVLHWHGDTCALPPGASGSPRRLYVRSRRSAAARRRSGCNSTSRRTRAGSRPGSSATRSNSARRASIRAPFAPTPSGSARRPRRRAGRSCPTGSGPSRHEFRGRDSSRRGERARAASPTTRRSRR